MKITIDREGCIECGICEASCPDIFELKNNEKARIVEKYRSNSNPASGEVGADLASCARDAADGCPVSVITVI
jgi:ferredoxin